MLHLKKQKDAMDLPLIEGMINQKHRDTISKLVLFMHLDFLHYLHKLLVMESFRYLATAGS